MIVVKVELHSARTGKVSVLGEAVISNVGGTKTVGKYRAELFQWNAARDGRGKTWKKGWIEGFPRLRLGPWDLLHRCLDAIVGDRNRERAPELPEQGAAYWKQRALEAESDIALMKRTAELSRIATRRGSMPMLCGHANECPFVCSCPEDCYCKSRTCAGR